MSFINGFLEVFKPQNIGYLAGMVVAYCVIYLLFCFIKGFFKVLVKDMK